MFKLTRREALAAAASVALVARRATAQSQAGARGIDQALRDAVATGKAPGIVAVAATDKGPCYAGAFGKRNVDKGPDMTVDTVFWIASMTKAVTTAAAMQMVEQGKLNLDAPAGDVLPELRAPMVLEGFDMGGRPELRPAKRTITLRRLLTHTAGFTYDIWNANTGTYERYAKLPGIITCKNDALKTPLEFDPGQRWDYGTNIDFAGKMVEKVSGQRLEEYFHDHIFGPLGMTDTGFHIGSRRSRLATVHQRQPDNSFKPIEIEVPQDPEFYMGGGGLYSTAPDYLKFVQMFLHQGTFNGAQVLQPQTVVEMSRNQIGDLNVVKLKTVLPQTSADAEFFPGMVKKWGLGFMINTEDAPTGRSAGSLAWAGVCNTYFWIDPKKKVGGVIMMQFLPFADPQALQAFAAFESAVYKALETA